MGYIDNNHDDEMHEAYLNRKKRSKKSTPKAGKPEKTYVFDKDFNFVKAHPSKLSAVMKTTKKGCFFFSQVDIRKHKHIALFKSLIKFQPSPIRKKALDELTKIKKGLKKK